MILKKLILRLLTVIIFANISSGKKCYAPVICNYGDHTETTWTEIFPTCHLETKQVQPGHTHTHGQKGEKGEMRVIAGLSEATLEKVIEAQRTANDAINATIFDQQRVIKTINKSVEFLKEENKNETSKRAKLEDDVADIKSESVKMNKTFTKQTSEFEAKLVKLLKAARKNEKDISDIQTTISSNGENSVAVTTSPIETSTQADFVTTASRECKDGDTYYGGYCFWFDVTRRNFAESESKCRSRNSTIAFIMNNIHYDFIMKQLRAAMIPTGDTHWLLWLGLQQDTSTGAVTINSNGLKAPFLKWKSGEPGRGSSDTNIFLMVLKDASSVHNGMEDCGLSWCTAGVFCQYKSV